MKIGIYYDAFLSVGGATRVVTQFANHLNADIITSGVNTMVIKELKYTGKVIDIGNFSNKYSKSFGYLIESPLRFLFTPSLNYDVHIFTGSYSIFAAKKGNKNLWFCFTPNRFLYDLKDWKINNSVGVKKYFFQFQDLLFKSIDQTAVKDNIGCIIAQTKNVQQRVKKYYGLESEIIYSPIDTSLYRFNKFGDYYLSVSRLMPEKRMDLIARAFVKMKDKKLILVGSGPEQENVRNIIRDSPNITLLTDLEDRRLIDLYSNCFATVYMPINEDYGLVPLEANASGKICIAANEGGCKETVKDQKTGLLIKPTIDAICATVAELNNERVQQMSSTCLEWVKRFDVKNSIRQMKLIINSL